MTLTRRWRRLERRKRNSTSVFVEKPRLSAIIASVTILGGALTFCWYRHCLVDRRYHQIMDVAYAQAGAREIAVLQKLHYHRYGRYADHLESLAALTASPKEFLEDMGNLFDAKTVKIAATDAGYKVKAQAMDDRKTLVSFNGP